jgi:hypothetical protein
LIPSHSYTVENCHNNLNLSIGFFPIRRINGIAQKGKRKEYDCKTDVISFLKENCADV